jgi:DNA-3-methyladenine glycosylase II
MIVRKQQRAAYESYVAKKTSPEFTHDRLITQDAVDRHLKKLLKLDPRLVEVAKVAGSFPPRFRAGGFSGLARIVCGQQLSVASADAIWSRLEARRDGTTPEGFLALGEEGLKGVGLSGTKHRTLTNLAVEVVKGTLDFTAIEALPAEDAIAELTRHKGIGPWTAEIYLMFCAGHPDVFPAGDLAVQKAVQDAFRMRKHPDRRKLIKLADSWSPYRTTAALLFWRYYAARKHRKAVPL